MNSPAFAERRSINFSGLRKKPRSIPAIDKREGFAGFVSRTRFSNTNHEQKIARLASGSFGVACEEASYLGFRHHRPSRMSRLRTRKTLRTKA